MFPLLLSGCSFDVSKLFPVVNDPNSGDNTNIDDDSGKTDDDNTKDDEGKSGTDGEGENDKDPEEGDNTDPKDGDDNKEDDNPNNNSEDPNKDDDPVDDNNPDDRPDDNPSDGSDTNNDDDNTGEDIGGGEPSDPNEEPGNQDIGEGDEDLENGGAAPIDDNNNDPDPNQGENNGGESSDPTEEEPEDIKDENHPDDEIDEALTKGDKVFEELFKYGNKISIELDFTNQSILKLQEYGKRFGNNDNFVRNEMYHPCTMKLDINGKEATYYEVGARMRGNTSRNDHFINENGYFNEGENFHFKLNFGQTFDNEEDNDYYINPWTNEDKRDERDDRKLGKMKKIDFKWNRNYDNTFTKELYVLDSFREEGVLAQHGNLVDVTIKTENDSRRMIYQMLESVDKQLLKKADSSDNKGDLYKCVYQNSPADLTSIDNLGVEDTGFRPTYGLKTNESESDMSVFKTFIDNVKLTYKKNGSLEEGDQYTGEMYYENIKNYLDVDNFLRYSALCWVFGLPDDLRNNANNYYIYFNKNNKALFLPYDNDRCLGIYQDWPINLKDQAYDDPYGRGYNEFNKCPLILRLVTGGSNNTYTVCEETKEIYHQYCIQYANKYLDVSKFEEFTNAFEGITNTDISIGGGSNDSFEVYASAKKSTLN